MVLCYLLAVCACVAAVDGAEANLRSELKYKEAELESLKQAASTEERERAEVLASEKKTRIQVS